MKNIRNAYYARGRCYAKGIGVPVDLERAETFKKKALFHHYEPKEDEQY